MNAKKRVPSHSLSVSRHRLVIWLGVFTLLLSLLGPLVAIQIADAREHLALSLQGEPPDCDENFEPNAEGTECVPIAANGVTDPQQDQQSPPDDQQGQEPDEQQQDQTCPEGEIWDQSIGACVQDPGAPPPQDQELDIQQQEQQAEEDPVPDATTVVQDAVAPDGYNYLDLYKYNCQLPAPPPAGAALNWYEDNCAPTAEWDFQLEWVGGASTETTDASGRASWSGLPTGTWTATEFVPDFYETPIVWCRYTEWPPEAGVSGEWAQFTAPGGVYSSGFGYEQMRMECRFYNIAIEEAYAEIRFDKFWCPPNLAFVQPPTASDLIAACQETGPINTRFVLDGPNPPYEDFTIDGSPGASRTWRNLPPGTYTVSEELPDGASYQLRVFCIVLPPSPNGQQLAPQVPQEWEVINGNTVRWTAEPGGYLGCGFFNFLEEAPVAQDAGYNYLDLYKFYCQVAAAPPANAELSWYEDNCDPVAQWDFQLEWTGGQSTETTDADGRASWSGLPAGDWTATEFLPDSYKTPVVLCRYTEWPPELNFSNQWSQFEAPGGVFSTAFGYEQMRMECRFYNIFVEEEAPVAQDAGYNYLDLDKFYCPIPAPPSADATLDWHEDNCDPVAQWDFHLEWVGGESTETTDASGRASWSGLPVGTWTAAEPQLQPGDLPPTVWCRYTEWPDEAGVTGEWALADAPGGVYSNGFGYDQMRMECRFYNVPKPDDPVAPEAAYNYLDLYKFYCAIPAAPPADADLTWYEDNCEATALWDFNLEWVGGESTETTDETGRASWSGLPTGTWTATEFLPDFYETPVVWCRYTEWPDQAGVTGEWAEFEAPGGVYSNGFGYEQMRMECRYYNIFIEDENTVTVYKWDCVAGTEYGQGLPYYQGEGQDEGPCETEHLQVPMSLIDANGDRQLRTQANGTQWAGVALQNGSFQIIEQIPLGYGDPMVFCGTLDEDSQNPVPATGGAVTLTPATQPFAYQCNWYNIPEGEYQLELYKFLCSPEVDPSLGLPDLGTACAPIAGVSFTATFGATPASARYTNANGRIIWTDAQSGAWSLQETMLPGWGPPKVFCGPPQTTETPEVPVVDLTVSGMLDSATPQIICVWFNFEREHENGRITVYKYQCPPGTTDTDFAPLQRACTIPFNGVNFTLQTGDAAVSASTGGGTVDWLDLEQGTYTVREHLLPGYAPPLVWCGYVRQDGVNIDPADYEFGSYPVTEGAIQLELNNFPARIVCHWYNFPTAPGEITINKWLCPPGYDMDAWGADPATDCTTPQNGVTFTLDQPEGVDLTTNTGDSLPGAVYFGGLTPGAYTVMETVPPDIAYVFVLDCTGTNIPKVHQRPLSWGNRLDVNLAAGDAIFCNWYNVPRPENGWLTVYKYQCWTTAFTSAVDCEIYEFGASFELFGVPDGASYGTGATNATGFYTWNDLDVGSYRLDEFSARPCKVTSTKVDGTGNARVDAGEGTVIKVYNCSPPSPPTTPGAPPVAKPPPGKVPGKFPNTGVAPLGSGSPQPARQGTPEGIPDASLVDEYYRISCLDATPDVPAATPTATETAAAGATATPEEFDLALPTAEGDDEATPTPRATSGRVTIVSRPGEPAGSPASEEECGRGALPERVVIEAANVDAGVETLEIIDGIMQQPTGPTLVTWYKETGRLGESNNVVIAGHLNWWNVPEGVFFRLQDLREGDRVEVTGDDGRVYVYEVQWVRQESNLEPPAADVIGPTDEPTLTLITCGGEWNADIAEYDERTVARAVQVDVTAAEDADAAASSPLLARLR